MYSHNKTYDMPYNYILSHINYTSKKVLKVKKEMYMKTFIRMHLKIWRKTGLRKKVIVVVTVKIMQLLVTPTDTHTLV